MSRLWRIQGGGEDDRDISLGGRDRIRTCFSSCHSRLRSGSLGVGATDLAGLDSRSRYDNFDRAGLAFRRALNRGRGDGGGSSVATADDLERAGLGSRSRWSLSRERATASPRGRLDRRLTIPGFVFSPLERLVSPLGPASESEVSASAAAFRRGYAFLVAFSTNELLAFGVATGGPLVTVGSRK